MPDDTPNPEPLVPVGTRYVLPSQRPGARPAPRPPAQSDRVPVGTRYVLPSERRRLEQERLEQERSKE